MLRRGDCYCYEICWPAPQVVQILKFEEKNNKIEGTMLARVRFVVALALS
jgi:hypothetical protein